MSRSVRVFCLTVVVAAAGVLAGSAPAVSTGILISQVYGGAWCPRNTSVALAPCGGASPALSINDVTLGEGNAGTTSFTFTVALSAPAGAGGVTFDIGTQDNTATLADNDYVLKSLTNQSIGQGQSTYMFSVDVNGDTTPEANESFFVNVTNISGATLLDGQGLGTITNDDVTLTPIHDIQGATHISPLGSSTVSTSGIVTANASNGFWIQDPSPDANDATSEGIFVFTSSAPTVVVGASVVVTATVSEFRPGGASSTNLTTTELGSPSIAVTSSGNALPAAIVVGTGGRVPPTTVIEDDAAGSVETSGVFDPATDGIDFYESLEGMRVQLNNPVASGPRNSFGEISVLPDDGAGASVRTTRGGIVVRASDFNPERVILDDVLTATPVVNTRDHFSPAQAVGIMDYGFGNFKLEVTTALSTDPGGLAQEVASTPSASDLSIATFNVENLDPNDGAAKFNALAATLVTNLKSPDIVALEEIQDNNGATNDGTVDASTTFTTLISAITAVSGPTYDYRQINPVDNQDGGEPGGNIRVGFIFNPSRVTFVDKPGGTSTNANSVSATGLAFSPGRIDPTNAAFSSSRKPLAAEFTFNSQKVFLIANHFNSKGGDDPLFGRFQPPTLSSEAQRNQQAAIVNSFVDDIIANYVSNPQIVVLGDFNDFEFSNPLNTLKGGVLVDEIETLPQGERYTYVFDGNSQALDHILVNNNVTLRLPTYDVVHVNSEFAVQNSDHEPQLLRYDPTSAPTAAAVTSLSAVRRGGSTVLRWRTGSEVGIAGFNVYREQAGRKVRLNRKLIAAAGTALGRRYAWNAGRVSSGRLWLQVVRRDGSRTWRGPVRVTGRRA